jgi:hypothetical protein
LIDRLHSSEKPHQRRHANEAAAKDAEDLPPDLGRHGLARDAVDQRIASDGGGR